MKVSIIVPAWNSEKYIKRCLDALINQVYKNIEIIIIDDYSTDNTKTIIKEYANKDARIIPFFSDVNKGVSASRNIGLKAATGDYIMFVDSDDELTKDAIRRLIDVANKYNSDFVDSYQLLRYTKQNGKTVSFTEKKIPKNILVMGNLEQNPKILNMYTYIKGKLIKRSLLEDLYFDEKLLSYEDLVFEHQLKTRINNYVFINKIIYIYYQVSDSLINILGKKHIQLLDAIKIVKEIYADYSYEIRIEIEATLIQTMFLTIFTKIIKNNDTLDENVKLVKELLNEITNIFPDYKENKKINPLIKRYISLFISNKQKLKKFTKKLSKLNLINLYFVFLSIINKYEISNPLKQI